jgi:hypothetical protein
MKSETEKENKRIKKKESTQLGWPIRPTKPTQRKVFFFLVHEHNRAVHYSSHGSYFFPSSSYLL